MRTKRIAGVGEQRVTSKATRSATPVRPAVARAIDLSAVPPLHWWRKLPADVFTGAHVRIIRKAISGIAILNEPRWSEAAKGDPAIAIGIALRTARRSGMATPCIDLVMSAVLLAALLGDPAAALTLATMIKRKGATAERTPLIASWLGATRTAGCSDAAEHFGQPDGVSMRTEMGA
jgi:hypothetical protein